MATFGEILQELRQDKKLSQKQLGDIIFVTTGTISNYENNHHFPDIDKLIMLADYFEVTTDYLLGRSSVNLSPDVFEDTVAQGKTLGSFIEDFKALSPDRQKMILLSMNDMKISMMLNQYSKKELL